jgi:lysophospholipase L1-like esterase
VPAGGVAFVGDSIFYNYQHTDGAPVWDAAIEPLVPKNIAVPGYTTDQVLAQLDEGALADASPQAVVLSVGINDLVVGKTPEQVAAGVWWVVQTLQATEPQAEVLVQSLLPTRGLPDPAINSKVDLTNWWLTGLDDASRVRYVPVNGYFRLPDGSGNPDLLVDGVHPNLQGYEVITAALMPLLTEQFQATAPPQTFAPPSVPAGRVPVAGDWDGDGTDGIGIFDVSTGTWHLRTEASAGEADAVFPYGLPGWKPVVGDWDGDGTDGIGVFDPSTGRWYLRNEASPGEADAVFDFGLANWLPVAGDWDGDGTDSVGIVDPQAGTWYLSPGPGTGPLVASFPFGLPNWIPVAGDWDNDGDDEVGVVDPGSMTWYLNTSSQGDSQVTRFDHGAAGWRPVVGDWDGMGSLVAVVDPDGVWHIRGSGRSPFSF